jgi:diaminopimelate epimerase
MNIEFTKMQGLGNDFVVINAIDKPFALNPAQIRHLADRHEGVGCDQVLVVAPPSQADVDFDYKIYNQDGGEVEQCGNGARCFARFVREKGISNKSTLKVLTKSGIIELQQERGGEVTVNMGIPQFKPDEIPFSAPESVPRYTLRLPTDETHDIEIEIGVVSMGNPHAVTQVADVATAPVAQWGPMIESHPRFPQRVNAGFMQVIDRGNINLRVFERGVGETRACGTGACAAVVVGRNWRLLDECVDVNLPGGKLTIRWRGNNEPVYMTGPAQTVFEGRISL